MKELDFKSQGYSIIRDIYSNDEISSIIESIQNHKTDNKNTIDTNSLYAIRQLINYKPEIKNIVFNNRLKIVLNKLFSSDYFLTKAIYFDKPPLSNWFVSYHQDLSISVDKKSITEGYKNWTFKNGQYGVQPPVNILENTVTVRIHLDDTTKENGALRVIPKSHIKGVIRIDSENFNIKDEKICELNKGDIMLMKPLLLHASSKTTNKKRRRVIHLEFNDSTLHEPLEWLEYQTIVN